MRNIIGKGLLAVSLFLGQLPSAFAFSMPMVWADDGVGAGSGITPSRLEMVQEEDGSPSVAPYLLKVPNTTLTDNADGTVSLGGLALGSGAANRIAYWSGASSLSSSSTFLFDGTNLTLPSAGDVRPSANATNALNIADAAGTDFVTFDSTNSRVGIGTAAPSATLHLIPGSSGHEILMPNNLTVRYSANDAAGNLLLIAKRRGTVSSPALVASEDRAGSLQFGGYDGSVNVTLAQVAGDVDATPGASDMPGRLTFSTVPDGSATLSERMRITSAGRVGIGTTSPDTLFNAVGRAVSFSFLRQLASGDATSNDARTSGSVGLRADTGVDMVNGFGPLISFVIQDDGGSGTLGSVGAVRDGADNTGALVFQTLTAGANTERMRITNDGLVGIGVSPATQQFLHIAASQTGLNQVGLRVENTSTGRANLGLLTDDVDFNITMPGTGDGSAAAQLFVTTADALTLGTNNLERMRIVSGGNIGLGTTTPRALLHVGTVAPGAALDNERVGVYTDGDPGQLGLSRASTDGSSLSIEFFKSRGTHASPTIVASGDQPGAIEARAYDGATFQRLAGIEMQVDGTPGVSDMPGRIVFRTSPDGTGTVTERLRITNAGRFGFNTTTPSTVIHVVQPDGTSGAETGNITWISDAYSESLADRNVAFTARRARGTSAAPASLLADDRLLSISSQGWTTGTSFGESALIRTNAAANHSSTSTPGYMTFWTTAASATSPTERMRIDSAGNVGIGLTSPGAPLHVATKNANNIVVAIGASAQQTSGGEALILGQTSDVVGTAQGNAVWLVINHAAASGAPNMLFRSTFRDNADANTSFVGSRIAFSKIAGANSSNIDFATTNASVTTDRMRITETGNVGIGDTTPDALLESNNGTSTSDIFIASDNDTPVLTVADGGAVTLTSTLTSSRTTDFGWAVVTGANTACNTSCVSACIFGQDTDTANGPIVGCADASADRCLCAGSS